MMAGQDQISTEVQVALYSIVGIISFISNSMIFLVIGTNKKLQTKSNFLLLSLALTDWFITVLGLPPQLLNLISGKNNTKAAACDIFGFLILVPFLATNLNLTLIAVHRYVLVARNNIYRKVFTNGKTVMAVALVWLTSILLALPPLIGWGRYSYNEDRAHCMIDWSFSTGYLVFLQVFAYPFPMAAMCFSYYKILKHSYRSSKRLEASQDQRNIFKKKREIRLTIMLLLVLCGFFILYFPYASLIIYEGMLKKTASHIFSFVAMFSAYCNSMLNFWIYAGMNTKFRQALFKLVYDKIDCIIFTSTIQPTSTSYLQESNTEDTHRTELNATEEKPKDKLN